MANPIITENQNIGTTNWKPGLGSTTQIQGYVSASSVNPGDSLSVYASTQSAGTTYTIDIYRMGYYQGTGGRLMQSITGQVGVAQGYFDNSNLTLNNCPTAFNDVTTGLLEARWASSYTLNIPSNWITGVYLIKFTDANGYQSYTKFIVRSHATADYVAVCGDLTWAAYNNWGGKSLYTYNSTSNVSAAKVSLDRPSVTNNGGDALISDYPNFIKWVESQGYNIGYFSGIDVHATSGILNTHGAYISLCHDEYWTKEERDAVEAARNAGIGLAFMGGNSCYWQVRLEAGGQNCGKRHAGCS